MGQYEKRLARYSSDGRWYVADSLVARRYKSARLMSGRKVIGGQRETVKVLDGPDGRYRVIIFRRADGLYGFGKQYLAKSDNAPSRWVLLSAEKTLCDTAEKAEREARDAFAWLSAANPQNPN